MTDRSGTWIGSPHLGSFTLDYGDGKTRQLEGFVIGPLLAWRWTPRLGEGPYETRHRGRPRRWTFALSKDWARPWLWEFRRPV